MAIIAVGVSTGAGVSSLNGQSGDVTIPTLASGTYTPTLTGVANISASTSAVCQYLRVGSVVTVSGKFSVTPTLAVLTKIGISLPVASNISATENIAGKAGDGVVAPVIYGDATNDRAEVMFTASALTSQTYYFTFTYLVA